MKKVFREIKKVKPTKLYVAADGPRTEEERKKTDAVRNYILKNISWKCKVKKLFRDKNLGCKYAVSSAIDWFFKNEEQGIILEDDCLPSQSFFRFCQELLKKYKNNDRIMSISGFNPLGKFEVPESYIFSKNAYCWGWATWKRAWKKMDLELKKYKEVKNKGELKKYYPSLIERKLIEKRVKDILKGKINTWAIPWSVSHRLNQALSIVPKINLVENIGFLNEFSTHTRKSYWDKKFLHHKAGKMEFPLKHPKEIKLSEKFDSQWIKQDIKRILLKNLF